MEKKCGIWLQNYRRALNGTGANTVYQSVNNLILEHFPHWINDLDLEKWKESPNKITKKDRIKKQAEELGIKILSKDTIKQIQEKIDNKTLSNTSSHLSVQVQHSGKDEKIYNDIPKKPTKPTKKQTAIINPSIENVSDSTKYKCSASSPKRPSKPKPSDIGILHKTYLKMRADNMNTTFREKPELWKEYHQVRKKTFATYDPDSIPANMIIKELEKIQTKRQKKVVDMGCGEAPIAHHFINKNDARFTFYNYDHQSGGDANIKEVDISNLPLEDNEAEIAIMSLALWGTNENCVQYIKEAYRVLESGGKFYIADVTEKWSIEEMTSDNAGQLLRNLLVENGFKIINENIGKPFCLFVCSKLY